MINKALFSSDKEDWATPQGLFDELNKEFSFTLDPCADHSNHKCERYFTKEIDGLRQDWSGEVVFVNPPYGSKTALWVKKCYEEVHEGACKCAVMLIAARTDTRWFHDYIYGKAEIRFIKGRVKFGNAKNSAPFPSMLAIFKKQTGVKAH